MSTAPRIVGAIALNRWYAGRNDELRKREIVEAVSKAERGNQERCLLLPGNFPFYSVDSDYSDQIGSLVAAGLLKMDRVEGVRPRASFSGGWWGAKGILSLYQRANDAISKGASRENVSERIANLLRDRPQLDDY